MSPDAAATDDESSAGHPAAGGREHYIPIRKRDLVAALSSHETLDESSRAKFRHLCRLLEATIHFDYHDHLESLKNAYAHFDPDSDTICLESADGMLEQTSRLFQQFAELLERANYRHLSHADIEKALEQTGDWGLDMDVDFDLFERLEVFARGMRTETRRRRRWWKCFRHETSEYEVYVRLVVIFKLNDHPRTPEGTDTQTVYIKIFKDIPQYDLDTLLPGTRVKMTLFDQGQIAIPTLGGIGITIYKIAGLAVAATMNVIGFLIVICTTIGYGVKSFFGYLRTKEKHQSNLTKNLYFQNLDNNAGVLFRLLDEAEEQEFREAMLAYFLLWQHASAQPLTTREIDDIAESYLRRQFGIDSDFEVEDAIGKLCRFKMIVCHDDDRYSAVPIDEALRRLDETWDGLFLFNNH